MNTAQIIPFRFESREVRTLLIDDQPWFVASDVASALHYRDAFNMCRNLDDDEKGTQIVSTPKGAHIVPTLGGDQEMTVINESGLYSAILRSRKPEAKRFKKWVTSEVLPAIRKHGRYEDTENKMAKLVNETIGQEGFHLLGNLIHGKVNTLPPAKRRRAVHRLWNQLHVAFGVSKGADLPAEQMDSARQFIAAYAIEGEYLPKSDPTPVPQLNLNYYDHFPGQKWLLYRDMFPGLWDVNILGFMCNLEQYEGKTVPLTVTGTHVLKREVMSLMSTVDTMARRLDDIHNLSYITKHS